MTEQKLANDLFDVEFLRTDLKKRSIRGGAVTIFTHSALFVTRLGSTVVLARLLTPQDFGLIAMVTVLINFALMFKDMGLSTATIQKADINHSQISTLFWINVGLGFLIAVVIAVLAPVIAWFYGEPRLINVTLVLATAFIFGGLTVQHQALLSRQMRFMATGICEVLGMIFGVSAAIIGAYFGAGYWSLVIMHVGTPVGSAISVWIACRWLPGLPKLKTGVYKMLAFGGDVTGFKIINYFARNLEKILLGKFYGSSTLGLYNKAYGLMMLPVNQIRNPLNMVALPGLSSLQEEPVKLTKYYTKLVSIIAFASMPLLIFLASCPENIIRILLGNQWLEAVEIFQVLAIAAFIKPIGGTRGVVMLSLGQSRRFLKWGVIKSSATVLSFIIGIPWGAIGIAISYTISEYLLFLPSLWYCFHSTPVSPTDFLRAISQPVIASLFMGVIVYVVNLLLVNNSDIMTIGICLVIGLLTYFLAWLLMPGGKKKLQEYISYCSVFFKKQP